jgi:UDP-N-acetylglucosamine 2-epimerase (non-hydrolysing)
MAAAGNPFGDGRAAERILAQLAEDFAEDFGEDMGSLAPVAAFVPEQGGPGTY